MTDVQTPYVAAPVPADVAQAAAAAHLGAFRATFPPSKRWRIIIPLGFLAVMFTGLLLIPLLDQNSQGDTGGIIAFGVMAAIPVVLLLWAVVTSPLVSAKARLRAYHVFDHGYVHVTRQGPVAYRWDGVQSLLQAITNVRYNGINTGTNYRFELIMADGRKTILKTLSTDMSKFGPVVANAVTEVQVPRVMDAVRGGHTIPFGTFAVSASGLTVGKKGLVPWPEVTDVSVYNGYVRVSRAGKRTALASVQAKNIPNLYTFLTVVERLVNAGGSLRDHL